MARFTSLPLVCSLALAGCVFSGDKSGTDLGNEPVDMATVPDAAGADMTVDVGRPDPPDMTMPDLGGPDVADMGPDDVGSPDMPPDMPPAIAPSSVCDGDPTSNIPDQNAKFRIHVDSTDARIFAGYVVPGDNGYLLAHYWSQWDDGQPYWVGIFDYSSGLNNPDEVDESEVNGVAVLPIADTGLTDVFITRKPEAPNTECLYGEFGIINQGRDCVAAWGAAATNTANDPRYVWFGDGATIGSTEVDEFGSAGQQFIVPWCAQDPNNPTECLSVDFLATDARGNRGPNVLLSDSVGRAYLWDSVQASLDGTTEEIDCTTPPSAPVPLMWQGDALMFEHVDVVRLDSGQDILVRQTATTVSLHPLDQNLQPMASIEELPNSGLRPLFDAATDGTRIAAATGAAADIRLFAFGAEGSTLDVTADDADTTLTTALGITVLAEMNQVGIVIGINGVAFAAANAYIMWSN